MYVPADSILNSDPAGLAVPSGKVTVMPLAVAFTAARTGKKSPSAKESMIASASRADKTLRQSLSYAVICCSPDSESFCARTMTACLIQSGLPHRASTFFDKNRKL
jgi:hypothetical protein